MAQLGASSCRMAGQETRRDAEGQPGPLPLPLRNRLAELILEAFEPGEARATLRALARVCGTPGASIDAADDQRLMALGWFEPDLAVGVRLVGGHRAHARALGERAGRAVAAVGDWEERSADPLVALLDRAAALANHGLFFEVHELLEPAWFRAAEPLRTALQGLIQISVGFHHLTTGNHAGARSLLADGVAKVAGGGAALPLDATRWLGELRDVQATLAAGAPTAPIPRWPAPG